MANETAATYRMGGKVYEIDHAGTAIDTRWGEFAVYCEDEYVAEFTVPDCPDDSLPPEGELIRLAREAVALDEAADVAGS